jgi:phosphohistidine phosphatase
LLELAYYLGYKAAIVIGLVGSLEYQPTTPVSPLRLMKTLYLLRHAKSSWDDPDLKDFERPLSDRGISDIPLMAERFLQRHDGVACIICSPALRAKTTAKLMAQNINFPVDDIVSNPELYFAGSGMFLKAASLVDDNCASAMLVGHNPAITEFACSDLRFGGIEIAYRTLVGSRGRCGRAG